MQPIINTVMIMLSTDNTTRLQIYGLVNVWVRIKQDAHKLGKIFTSEKK